MKKLALLLASLVALSIPSLATIIVSPSTPVTTNGDTIQIGVYLTGAPADLLFGYGFNVTVQNSGVATLTNYSIEPGFTAPGAIPSGTNVLASALIDTTDLGQYTEPFLLTTLTFSRAAFGSTTYTIQAVTTDPNQGVVYLTADPEAVNVSGTLNFVPEPSTFLLGGLFTIGLLAAKLRRK